MQGFGSCKIGKKTKMQNNKFKKIKNLLFNFWPLLFIVFLWFIFSSPFLIQHKIPYPAKYQVSFFTPWSEYKKYAGPVKNNAIPDVVDQIYPWKYFTIEQLLKGKLPLWNPYSFSGTPNLANYQTAVFSPFNLLFLFLPFVDAWSLLVLFQPLIAGISMYLFLKQLRISNTGSVIGGVSFMFCGFIVVWMAYGTLSMAIAFLPLALFAIEKIFQSKKFIGIILLFISIVVSFFSGHFQTSLYLVLYVFFYILFKYFSAKDFKKIIVALSVCFLGILIASIQILPSIEFYKLSVRSEIFSNTGGIPFQYLVTIFSPDFYGSPITGNSWFGYYAEWAGFIGIIPFILASFGFFARKQNNSVVFFIFATLISLFLFLDTPLQSLISALKIPIFSTSVPSRMIVIFSFSVIVLSGFGFDLFIGLIKKRNIKKIVLHLSPIVIIFFILWFILILKILPPGKIILSMRNLFLPTAILVFIIGLTILFVTIKKDKALLFLGFALIILSSFDSLRFANKWMPFDSPDLIFPSVPVITEMQKSVGTGRVYGEFGSNIETYYHIPSIEGYDPLYSKRYGEFIESSVNGELAQAKKTEVFINKRGKYTDRVLDLLGVNIIFHPISRTNQSWAYPVWEKLNKYSVIYQDDKFQLFKNDTVMPRVKLFHKYEVIKNDKKLIKRFYDDDFDFRNVLIVEKEPKIENNIHSNSQNKEDVKIITYSPNEITIEVTSENPALLFISDNYYPTWRASVNGQATNIYRVDYTFRAVVVPRGKSIVRFYLDRLL